jgi:hypothetical protein
MCSFSTASTSAAAPPPPPLPDAPAASPDADRKGAALLLPEAADADALVEADAEAEAAAEDDAVPAVAAGMKEISRMELDASSCSSSASSSLENLPLAANWSIAITTYQTQLEVYSTALASSLWYFLLLPWVRFRSATCFFPPLHCLLPARFR